MTKWLTDVVASVPADFVPTQALSYALPEYAEVIGRVPEESLPILRAYLYLLTESRNREDGTGTRRTFWEREQIKTLRLLTLTSVHYAFNLKNAAIGIGPDPKEPQCLVVYRITNEEEAIKEANLPRGIAILLTR